MQLRVIAFCCGSKGFRQTGKATGENRKGRSDWGKAAMEGGEVSEEIPRAREYLV